MNLKICYRFLILTLIYWDCTETRIIKEQNPTYDTSITGYKGYFTPTELTKGGTSLYINKNVESKELILKRTYIFPRSLNPLLLYS